MKNNEKKITRRLPVLESCCLGKEKKISSTFEGSFCHSQARESGTLGCEIEILFYLQCRGVLRGNLGGVVEKTQWLRYKQLKMIEIFKIMLMKSKVGVD